MNAAIKTAIETGRTALGIELGSTRIKASLIDETFTPIASGEFSWENRLEDGIWTYHTDEIHEGVKACYADLKKNIKAEYGITLKKVGAIGISGMMHGYLPFDADWNMLVPFRTWRNTITGEAAEKLTALFGFNIPQRWSIAHLYQAVLNKEDHLPRLAHLTTLAGYIHHILSGENVLGVGEASGMFPIDSEKGDYNNKYAEAFDGLIADKYSWKLTDVLPKVLKAGCDAGRLTKEGAAFLDAEGDLESGIALAPPEGDAGTGMVATNAISPASGNVSAGTSDFAMVVLEKSIGLHEEIDMVTTPDGLPVAMVHCNNCTSDINAWAGMLKGFMDAAGKEMSMGDLFTLVFSSALKGEKNGGGLIPFNYISGEGVTKIDEGRPFIVRENNARFTFENLCRANLMSAMATLAIGMKILASEGVKIKSLTGHGGFFKTPLAGQTILSAATAAPVSVMKSAGEGGPYGMAILGAYLIWKEEGEELKCFLNKKVFATAEISTVMADDADIAGFNDFLAKYERALEVEKSAVANID